MPSERQERFSEADGPKRSAGKMDGAEPDFYAQKSRDMPGWFCFWLYFPVDRGSQKNQFVLTPLAPIYDLVPVARGSQNN